MGNFKRSAAIAGALWAVPLLGLALLRRPEVRRVLAPAPRKPFLAQNVVLLCFDTVRADAFARYDGPGARDALAAWSQRAVVYDGARAPAPWTLPSVASVMTGLYPARHDAGRFPFPIANLDSRIPSAIGAAATLGEDAARSGMETAAFVSNPWASPDSGVLRGFNRIDRRPSRGLLPVVRGWLDQRGPSAPPFFLYVHWVDAHGDVREAEKRRQADALSASERRALVAGAPAATCADPEAAPCIRYLSYHREIELQRADVAELLALLEARRLLQDTLVVLFSDHGEEFGEHRDEERARGADPRGFYGVGHGHALYDEILRVPLLVWSPGERPRHDATAVSLVDIAPTIERRLGLPARRDLDGRPLPVGGPDLRRRALFASGIGYGPEQAAIIDDGRKEIAITCPEQTLLFDERRDPAEKRPAAGPAADPALAAALARYLARRKAEVAPMRLASAGLQQLRSLGYLRGSSGSFRERATGPLRPTTIGTFDPKTATFYLRYTNAPGPPDRVARFGAPGDVPVVGDWDGNGTTDLGVYRPSDRTFRIESRDGGTRTIAATWAGRAGLVPLAGDWDGSGAEAVALFDPSTGVLAWSARDRPDWETRTITAVPATDVMIPGKWRCAGRTELAVFRGSAGTFRFSEPNVVARELRFGAPGDVPIAGDWDGNGTVTIGVYRPATSTFLLRNSVSPGPPDLAVRFGSDGAIPVAGRWERPAGSAAPSAAAEIRDSALRRPGR